MKKRFALVLVFVLLLTALPVNTLAAKRNKQATPPVFKHHEFEHHYQLQDADKQDEEREIPSPHLFNDGSDQSLTFLAFLPSS